MVALGVVVVVVSVGVRATQPLQLLVLGLQSVRPMQPSLVAGGLRTIVTTNAHYIQLQGCGQTLMTKQPML